MDPPVSASFWLHVALSTGKSGPEITQRVEEDRGVSGHQLWGHLGRKFGEGDIPLPYDHPNLSGVSVSGDERNIKAPRKTGSHKKQFVDKLFYIKNTLPYV